jgi:hypothetical protein
MKCVRCNRPLKDPDSVERGMGEICAIISGIIVKNQKRTPKMKYINLLYKQNFLFDPEEENVDETEE